MKNGSVASLRLLSAAGCGQSDAEDALKRLIDQSD